MLLNWLLTRQRKADLVSQLLDVIGIQVPIDVEPRQRADQIRSTASEATLQGIGVFDVDFLEVLEEIRDRNLQAAAGDDGAFTDGDFVGMAQGDAVVRHLEVGKVERPEQLAGIDGKLAVGSESLGDGSELCSCRDAIEPADASVDGMDLAPAQHVDDLVSGLLELQCLGNGLTVVGRPC